MRSRRARRSIVGLGRRRRQGAGFKSFMKKVFNFGRKGVQRFHNSDIGKQVERAVLEKALGAAKKRATGSLSRRVVDRGGEELRKLIGGRSGTGRRRRRRRRRRCQ